MLTPFFIWSSSTSSIISSSSCVKPLKNNWTHLAIRQRYIWGIYQGSHSHPYKVRIDLTYPKGSCSCPSRETQCKHIRALHFLFQESPDAFLPSSSFPHWLIKYPSFKEKQYISQQICLPFMNTTSELEDVHSSQNEKELSLFLDNQIDHLKSIEPLLECCFIALWTLHQYLATSLIHSSPSPPSSPVSAVNPLLSNSTFPLTHSDQSLLKDQPSPLFLKPQSLSEIKALLEHINRRVDLLELPLFSWDLKIWIEMISALEKQKRAPQKTNDHHMHCLLLLLKRLHYIQIYLKEDLHHIDQPHQPVLKSISWDILDQLGGGLSLLNPSHKILLPKVNGSWMVCGYDCLQKAHLMQVNAFIINLQTRQWSIHTTYFSKTMWERGQRPYVLKPGTYIKGQISMFFGSSIPRCTWDRSQVKVSLPYTLLPDTKPPSLISFSALSNVGINDLEKEFQQQCNRFPFYETFPYIIKGTIYYKECTLYFQDQQGTCIHLLGKKEEISLFFGDSNLVDMNESKIEPIWVCLLAHINLKSSEEDQLYWSLGGFLGLDE